MDRVEGGERFTITRRGVPVAELVPITGRRQFVPVEEFALALGGLEPIDLEQMRAEADDLFGDGGDRVG